VCIALFVRDSFVRPYFGDTLAVALVYCGLRAVLSLRPLSAALLAFGIGCAIEIGQAIHILDLFAVHNRIVRVVLGGSFAWLDFVAYAAGAALVLIGERALARSPATN
jgi:hypothetical protein